MHPSGFRVVNNERNAPGKHFHISAAHSIYHLQLNTVLQHVAHRIAR